MKIAIVFLIIKLTYAGTNELCMAMSSQCQLDTDRVKLVIHRFSHFAKQLELAFHQVSSLSAQDQDVLREMDTPYIWLLLTTRAPTLLEDLKMVRDEVNKLNKELPLDKPCLDWVNLLLGDGKFNDGRSNFAGSYLELLIRSLSATKHTKLAELSIGQVLFVRVELRRMHIERGCFLPRNEEMHELYSSYVVVYTSLINLTLGQAVMMYAMRNSLSLSLLPLKTVGQIPTYLDDTMKFIKKYVDPQKDFFTLNGQVHLRKSSNFSMAYQKWVTITDLIPNVAIRREFFDEGKELLFNLQRIERQVIRMHKQKNNLVEIMKWDFHIVSTLTLAFDLVDSLISFQREKIPVTKVRRMLLEVINCVQCLKAVHELDQIIQ